MEGFTSSFLSCSSKLSSSISSFIADNSIIDHQNMELLINPPFATTQYEYDDHLINTTTTTSHSHSSSFNVMAGFTNDMKFFSQLPSALIDHHHHHHQFFQSFDQPAAVFQHDQKKNVMQVIPDQSAELKRKAMDHVSSNTNSGNSSVPENEIDHEKKYQSSAGRKGKKAKVRENGETSKEVVHVRARRGQATDSHSIAERVRRGKINERLRCLQDIVPGCYKSMGMAVMLDEIINYVQSLQNQVEFLSMKLTEASRFHNFDSDFMHMDVLQMGNVIEGLRMQRLEEREEVGLVDQSFGSYPSLPYHTT